MKLTIQSNVLAAALETLRGIINSKTTLPVLRSVYVSVGARAIHLTATNLDAEMTVAVPGVVHISGDKCIPLTPLAWDCFRSLSRLWMEIVSVRVERVQEISEEDARREGVARDDRLGAESYCVPGMCADRAAFAKLWDSINAKRGYSWAVNPWVWRIEFRKATKP